jgi:ATP-dependent Clp protease ATP-binding subunit ClpB
LEDVTKLERLVKSAVIKLPSQSPPPEELSLHAKTMAVINQADKLRQSQKDSHLSVDHIISALVEDSDISKILKEAGADKKLILNAIKSIRGSSCG